MTALLVAALLALAVALLPTAAGATDLAGAVVAGADVVAASEPDLDRAPGHPAALGPVGPQQVSSALTLLALAYRSGLATWDVLSAVASDASDPVARDLRQVAAALRWGAQESEAWASVGPSWAPAARAVAIAHQAGVPPGSMLLAAADDLHRADLERLEVGVAKVGVRLVAPLGLVLLPAFCLTTVVPLVVALAGRLMSS